MKLVPDMASVSCRASPPQYHDKTHMVWWHGILMFTGLIVLSALTLNMIVLIAQVNYKLLTRRIVVAMLQ